MSRRLIRALGLLAAVFAGGTIGYRLIEGADWWDSFYMTAITLTTVGYGEVFPLSHAGEVFTVLLLFAGLGLLLLVATEVGRWALEGELRQMLGHARRSRMIEKMTDHEIVCGWGRMGKSVVGELSRGDRRVVVIERDPVKLRRLEEAKIPVVEGDATSEAVLRAAGVTRARGLVACLNDDAHNVYTVLTARSLNPGLFIVARAGEEGSEARILHAGANRVVNPYYLGGVRLAHLLVKAAVVEFLDLSLSAAGEHLALEQVRLTPTSPLVGASLAEASLRQRWGVGVVAIQRGAEIVPNPESDFRLEAGDILVVLGDPKKLSQFEVDACP